MARPRKALKFADVVSPLSIADLKLLKAEVAAEIRIKEREEARVKSEADAKKILNKIRIGSTVIFDQRGAGGGIVEATVNGIFADKVQVEVDGRKRSVALVRIQSVK